MAYIDDAARVAETSTTTGTGDFTLAAAYDASYRRFSAVASVADTVPYTIVAADLSWEHGLGTYSAANTLTRTTVFSSSNAGAAVNFAAGAKVVFLSTPGVARSTVAATSKATPVDTDVMPIVDSGAGNVVKKLSWANLKATLKTYFDTLYLAAAGALTPTSVATTDFITSGGLLTQASEDNIVAFAGGGKASATPLSATKNIHRIVTVASGGDSVLMPPALPGQVHIVMVASTAAASPRVFAQGTDTINDVATASSIQLQPGSVFVFSCATAGAWRTPSYNPLFTGTIAVLNSSAGVSTLTVGPYGGDWQLGNTYLDANTPRVAQPSTGGFAFSSTGTATGTVDTQTSRKQAKITETNTGTAGSYVGTGHLLGPMTVAQLPVAAAGLKGCRATVSDATAPTYLATLVGGGAMACPAFCNGTAWVAA
jgi:hypothetical protein